jgi:hypothetical protein
MPGRSRSTSDCVSGQIFYLKPVVKGSLRCWLEPLLEPLLEPRCCSAMLLTVAVAALALRGSNPTHGVFDEPPPPPRAASACGSSRLVGMILAQQRVMRSGQRELLAALSMSELQKRAVVSVTHALRARACLCACVRVRVCPCLSWTRYLDLGQGSSGPSPRRCTVRANVCQHAWVLTCVCRASNPPR